MSNQCGRDKIMEDAAGVSNLDVGDSASKQWVSETKEENIEEQVVERVDRKMGVSSGNVIEVVEEGGSENDGPNLHISNAEALGEKVGDTAGDRLRYRFSFIDPIADELAIKSNMYTVGPSHIDPMVLLSPTNDENVIKDGIIEENENTKDDAAELSNHKLSTSIKRPRGRPKKKLPPCYNSNVVVQPSSLSEDEAQNMWNIAKMIGISTNNEDAVVSNLRKSKRLQLIEENAQV